ncbi:MAG: DUF4339 domain-containing protein [Verrucomicrobia bacterium]|nr:DUF4339 domain-containing protein [Verrucomicrobiota bacterium]NDD81855.1 DUF4339 domain-containing protein [Verrucomicrobiota bacterium]
MYSIIGGDGKTYGPVPPTEVERWIREGRADAKTKVKREGEQEWRELGTLDEFFPKTAASPPTLGRPAGPRHYAIQGDLGVRASLSAAWQAYRKDSWRITGVVVLTFLAQFLMNNIPVAGLILAFLLNGPILGGLYYFCRQSLHGSAAGAGDVTSTVRERFLPCFLATTVSNLLAFGPFLLGLIPAVALAAGAEGMDWSKLVQRPGLAAAMALPVLGGFLAMLYLLLLWSLAVPLAACSSMDFWEALKTSWHGVRANLLRYFILLILLAFLNLLGVLCLVIGLFVTIPLTLLATMAAYDHIFRPGTPNSR